MNVFDWLSNMEMPGESKYDVVEVRFKNGRKDFFRNTERLQLTTGDPIVVEVPNGHHIGYVSLQGELVRLQMQKKNRHGDGHLPRRDSIAAATRSLQAVLRPTRILSLRTPPTPAAA